MTTKQNLYLISILVIYYFLACFTLHHWQKHEIYPVTGDEPHYVVIASGLLKYHSFEQTLPYKDEFQTKKIYAGGLAPPDAIPSPANTHAVRGPHGLYNIHNIGLPILIALPYLWHGITGVKLFLILLSGLSIIVAWQSAKILLPDKVVVRAGIVGALCVGLPFLPASNQIFPGILAGVCSLTGLYWLLSLAQKRSLTHDFFYASVVAYLPWLQIKFTATAIIIIAAIVYKSLTHNKNLTRALVALLPLLISLIILACYNDYAFGKISGPYTQGALQISKTALMVLVGLHLDQNQGFLLQNPLLFAGVFAIALMFARDKYFSFVWLLVFLSLIVPNALHWNWYGGYAFVGRFEWAAATIFIIPAMLGLSRLGAYSKKILLGVLLGGLLLQAIFYVMYTFKGIDLYNTGSNVFLYNYPAFYLPIERWLPALYNVDWAYHYGPNYSFLLIAIALLVAGIITTLKPKFITSIKLILFWSSLVIIFLLGKCFDKIDNATYTFMPNLLPSKTGHIDGEQRVAIAGIDSPGFITYGPYTPLRKGLYTVTFFYQSNANQNTVIGQWDVFTNGQQIVTGAFKGTNNKESALIEHFKISDWHATNYEFRMQWNGHYNIKVLRIVLQQK